MKRVVAVAMVGLMACSAALATPRSVDLDGTSKTGTWSVVIDPVGSGGGSYDIDIWIDSGLGDVLYVSYTNEWDIPAGSDTIYLVPVVDGEWLTVDLYPSAVDYDIYIYDADGDLVDSSTNFGTLFDQTITLISERSSSSSGCVPGNGSLAGFLALLVPLAGAFIVLRRKVQPVAA